MDQNILSTLTPATLFGGVTLSTIVIALFEKIKRSLNSILNFFFCTIHLQLGYQLQCEFTEFLCMKYRRINTYPKFISTQWSYLRDKKIKGNIFYEDYVQFSLFLKFNIFPIWWGRYRLKQNKEEGSVNNEAPLSYFRGTVDIDKLLFEFNEYLWTYRYNVVSLNEGRYRVIKLYGSLVSLYGGSNKDEPKTEITAPKEDPLSSSYRGYRILFTDIDQIGEEKHDVDPFNFLALTQFQAEVLRDIESWQNSKTWFKERSIVWKMGLLLYGKPGTGKTSFTRALGEKFNLPVYVFDLSTMNNIDLIKKWQRILTDTPCIALFEDLDSIFDGRENRTKNTFNTYLTYDCFLNVLDGVERNDGVITVVTTNNVERLDQALCDFSNGVVKTRPGRIDKVIEFGILDHEGKIKIANNILKGYPESIDIVVNQSNGVTGAQFQQMCIEEGRKIYWKENSK